MAELLKHLYSPAFFEKIADSFNSSIPSFNKRKFLSSILDENFENMELKARMKHTSRTLHLFLPVDFGKAALLLKDVINRLRADGFSDDRFEYMFFPDYIETYGIEHYQDSIHAIEFVTQFISCEYAVRPFLIRYEKRMAEQMQKWSLHENEKVRRLSSEGMRPRLPWGMAVPWLKKQPQSIIPILENLKNDSSESVRRSVANNLNDISKDHPDLVMALITRWKGTSKQTDAVIKHASRTLLKTGHVDILSHYALRSKEMVVRDFKLASNVVKIGSRLAFTCTVLNKYKEDQLLRLEYGVYYRKANGSLSKKVFKISERMMLPGESLKVKREQSFKPITTRKFYPGGQQLSIIINGEEKEKLPFKLTL